jgi:hemolysin activation/secretion protein
LTAKDSASYLNGTKIITSERKLAIANFGFSVSSFFKNGTSLYLKPTYIRGTKLLNAKQDQANVSGVTPKAQFEAFKLYANFSKRFVIPKLQTPVTLSTEMDSQFAKQTLFGSEQFSVGGYYSVRGFRENYITGDSGYYFRNKASFGVARQLRIEPFYDYGYIKNKYVSNGADGRLSGTGIKTIFQNNYFSASLTYSWGINKSRLITSNVKENKLLYFEISASCC